jgi:transposase
LGISTSKKITALAGLAPMTQQSGKWQGKERITGGAIIAFGARSICLRLSPFASTMTSRQISAALTAGKAKKVAITAIMRRIIVLANTLLREGRDWQPNRP